MSVSPVKALLFDFDGLIVDTETPLYEAWRELYQMHALELPLETYVDCVGSTTHRFDPIEHLRSQAPHAPEPEVLADRHRAKVEEALEIRETLPGVRERIAEAQEAGILLGLASSSTSDWIDRWLNQLGLLESFTVVRTRDMVGAPKPAPDLFLSAAEALGVAPHEALVFEDSANGLAAAHAAEIPCVVVPNQITGLSDFSRAALRLQSLAECGLEEIAARLGRSLAF